MALTLTDMQRIAHLARLELADDSATRMLDQLNDFFTLVERMQAVDTSAVSPMAHPVEQRGPLALRLRADVVSETIDRDRYQSVAPAVEDGLYLVPKVIE